LYYPILSNNKSSITYLILIFFKTNWFIITRLQL